jgi:IS1 family transposase
VRATGVSERWLQYYVNQKLGAVKREVQVTSKKKGKLIIQCDEMWSFVGCKGNKQWIWLAIDILTKEIVGVYIGKRDESGAIGLWDSIPAVYRQCAVSYTDFWSADQIVFPKKRHKSVSLDSGKTNYIERFNNTMRQRRSRLVRKTLSFSKKLSNHIGAIWYFIHEYNASLSREPKA